MSKYIDAECLKAEIERLQGLLKSPLCECLTDDYKAGGTKQLNLLRSFITSHQQEQPEENKLPNKRTRVNYAICKLQSFKPLRETIALDDYVYDEGKCYRENLLNYIHAIPESRLTEIRSYLKEKGWWPYDDDADWEEQPHKSFCEENCKGYRDTGGKCFFGFNCPAKKAHEQSEVDLEKEIDKKTQELHITPCYDELKNFALYFYELGKTARKEE